MRRYSIPRIMAVAALCAAMAAPGTAAYAITKSTSDAGTTTDVQLLSTTNFYDVHAGDWYNDVVSYVAQNGYMTGYSDADGKSTGMFGPNDTMTRAMVATVLWNQAGSPEVSAAMPFSDCDANAWYAAPVIWASQNGIISGYGDTGCFGPGDNATREQIVTMFHNYAEYTGTATDLKPVSSLNFPDAGSVSDWALPAVKWAVGAGLISGYDSGVLAPQDNTTRGMCAAIIYNNISCDPNMALIAAQNRLKVLQKNYEEAQQSTKDAQTALTEAQAALDKAKSDPNAQRDPTYYANRGTAGFFEWAGYSSALQILNDYANDSYLTTLNAENDSTTIANLKVAIELAEAINAARAVEPDPQGNYGDAVLVSPALMALSEVRSNWSANQIAHHVLNDGLETSESLAWGYRSAANAVDGWVSEKAYFEQHPEYCDKSSWWIYQNDPTFYMSVGHYLDITDTAKYAIGTGYNTNSASWGTCWGYVSETKDSYGDAMSVDSFKAKLAEYEQFLSSGDGTVLENAQKAYDKAQQKVTDAQKAEQEAKDAVDKQNTEIERCKQAVEDWKAEQAAKEATNKANIRAHYKSALTTLRNTLVTPNGDTMSVDKYSTASDNVFAIADVDQDGIEELVIRWTSCITASFAGYVFEYDPDNDSWITEFKTGEPLMYFYTNGNMRVDANHNQSSGIYWPCGIYQVNDNAYEKTHSIYSISKDLVAKSNPEKYPSDIDTEGAGIVYVVDGVTISKSAFENGIATTIASDLLIPVTYQSLTESNIASM